MELKARENVQFPAGEDQGFFLSAIDKDWETNEEEWCVSHGPLEGGALSPYRYLLFEGMDGFGERF